MSNAGGWSDAHVELVMRDYGRVPSRELAAAVGRTVGALKQKARKLGLVASRAYTADEERMVRELYASHTADQIAVALYGTDAKILRVRKLVEKLGLRKWPQWSSDVLDRVRALHAKGLTDSQIARRMGREFRDGDDGRLQVRHIRLRLNLPANVDTKPACAARRRAVRRQFQTLGLSNPNELRQRAHRRFAAQYGLPEDLRPAQVRMVLALLEGPLTLPQLKEAIGARADSGLIHNERKTTYQADLVGRGLAARVPNGVGGRTKGPRALYMLTAACLDLLASAPKGDCV